MKAENNPEERIQKDLSTFSKVHTKIISSIYDEGVYILTANMFSKGYVPYEELFVSQPPLLFIIYYPFMYFSKTSLFYARFPIVIFGLAGLICVALITRLIIKDTLSTDSNDLISSNTSKWLGLFPWLSAVLLGLSYEWFELSRSVMPNIPQASLAVLSLLIFLLSLEHVKPSHLEFLTGVFISLVPLMVLFIFDISLVYDNMIGFHVGREHDLNVMDNILKIGEYIILKAPLMILALPGVIVCFSRKNKYQFIIVGWTLYQIFTLAIYSPLFTHHLVLLLPPFSITSSLLIFNLINHKNKNTDKKQKTAVKMDQQTNIKKPQLNSLKIRPVFLIVIIFFALIIPISYLNHKFEVGTDPAEQEAVEIIDQLMIQNEWVITDAQFITFLVDKLPPPALVDTSNARITNENLLSDEIIQISEEYNVSLIFYWTDRLIDLNEWNSYVQQNFSLKYFFDYSQKTWIEAVNSLETIVPANGQIWIAK